MISSAINNSSVDDTMSVDDLLRAADERLQGMNRDATITTAEVRQRNREAWLRLVETAKETLPPSIRPYVRSDRQGNRDDYPTKIAVAIDLPECERIHYGPWTYDRERSEYVIAGPWRNKPFEVAGGNREAFGDLLDAIARAREIYWQKLEGLSFS